MEEVGCRQDGGQSTAAHGALTTMAVEAYLSGRDMTMFTCQTRTYLVTLGLAAYISRTSEAFRASTSYNPRLTITCNTAIRLIVSYSST